MAVALISLTVLDSNLLPEYNILIDSSSVNKVIDNGTYTSINYYDVFDNYAKDINVAQGLSAITSQIGMINVSATNISGVTVSYNIGIQEFNIESVYDYGTYREIRYRNLGSTNDVIWVSNTLANIQAQTQVAGISGFSGASGVSGFSGISGWSGTSGRSGFSGVGTLS